MSYRVVLTDRAEADLDRLLASLANVSEPAAARLTTRFWEAVTRLREMPLSCGLAYENPRFAEELRHLLFGMSPKRKYRALFVVRGETVAIVAIRAPGERPVTPKDLKDPDS